MTPLQDFNTSTYSLIARLQAIDSFLLSLLPQNVPFEGIEFTLYYTTNAQSSNFTTEALRLCNWYCDQGIGGDYEDIHILDTNEGENATFVFGGPLVGNPAKQLFSLLLTSYSSNWTDFREYISTISDVGCQLTFWKVYLGNRRQYHTPISSTTRGNQCQLSTSKYLLFYLHKRPDLFMHELFQKIR